MDLVPGTLLERPTAGPDIAPLLDSVPGRIMEGCPAEPTGLVLERVMPQSPEPPVGDLWGTMPPLFIGPGEEHEHQKRFARVGIADVSNVDFKSVSLNV